MNNMKQCDCCSKKFDINEHREDGLPVGVTFIRDGVGLTLCADCLINIGKKKVQK